MAGITVSDCEIIGAGGKLAKVSAKKGNVTAEIENPFSQSGVLVIGVDMFARITGHRRVFHAPVARTGTVKFTRLTQKKRAYYEGLISNLELAADKAQLFRAIFYGEIYRVT